MIPKLHRRGVALHWLLRYLFSTRENEQHHDPRVIAAWAYATTGDIAELQPPLTPDGRYCLRRLTSLLHQPVAAGINPPDHPVWHCSIHNDADDPVLTDLDWANAATMIMDAVGLSPTRRSPRCAMDRRASRRQPHPHRGHPGSPGRAHHLGLARRAQRPSRLPPN
jgi:hypothetical protein